MSDTRHARQVTMIFEARATMTSVTSLQLIRVLVAPGAATAAVETGRVSVWGGLLTVALASVIGALWEGGRGEIVSLGTDIAAAATAMIRRRLRISHATPTAAS